MTSEELKAAQADLGWTNMQMAVALGLTRNSTPENALRYLLRMKNGSKAVTGPVETCIWYFLNADTHPENADFH